MPPRQRELANPGAGGGWPASPAVTADAVVLTPCRRGRCLAAANVELSPGHSSLGLSRAVSIALLLTYVAYLYFQLKTHIHLYEEQKDPEEGDDRAPSDAVSPALHAADGGSEESEEEDEEPIMSFWAAIGNAAESLRCVVDVLVAVVFTADGNCHCAYTWTSVLLGGVFPVLP